MAKYLSWDMLFKKSYYATARDELEKNKDSMNELEGIGKIYKARSKFLFAYFIKRYILKLTQREMLE